MLFRSVYFPVMAIFPETTELLMPGNSMMRSLVIGVPLGYFHFNKKCVEY